MTIHTPTERLAAILRTLASTPTAPVHSDDLRRLSPDYDGDGGDRTLRRDLRALRSARYIRTDITSDHTQRRTGVQLSIDRKEEAFHLSRGEHAALVRARADQQLAPFQHPTSGRTSHLMTGLDIVRYLEETGRPATGSQLAADLEQSPADLNAAVKALVDNRPLDRSAVPGLAEQHEYNEDADRDDDGSEDDDEKATVNDLDWTISLSGVEDLHVVVDDAPGPSPTLQIGLHQLGRFAYSLDETRDRLNLISAALTSPNTNDPDRRSLLSAHDKLTSWHAKLLILHQSVTEQAL